MREEIIINPESLKGIEGSQSDMELEEVKCNLCGSDDTKQVGVVKLSESQKSILSLEALALVQCRKCSLVYTNPRPSAGFLKELYDTSYQDAAGRDVEERLSADRRLVFSGGGFVTYDPAFCKRLLIRLERLAESKGRMLDVGCGEGRFIRFARDRGWQVFGQEFSSSAAEQAREQFGMDVRAGDLREIGYPAGHFDVVMMLNVIEHLQDPLGYLDEIRRILRPRGVFYLGTPNVPPYNDWSTLDVPEHLYRFSIVTMRRMLEKSGFRVVSITTRNRQDALVALDILRLHLLGPREPSIRADWGSFVLACLKLSRHVVDEALGIKLHKWGIAPNGGARITAFARKE